MPDRRIYRLATLAILVAVLGLGLAGCHTPAPAPRYIGPSQPLIGKVIPAPASQPMQVTQVSYAPTPVVRGQNGAGGWNGGQPNNGQPQFTNPPPPGGNVQYQGPPGYVGGTIPVQPSGPPQPVITYQPGQNFPDMVNAIPPGQGQVIYEPVEDPFRTAPVDVIVQETETGRFMFGVGVNSDAGVTGNIVIDERNFDIRRVPRSLSEFSDGTAFRGAGQGFRIEAVPGTQVQRYVVNFTEPYLFNTNVSFNVSGFIFTRGYQDWNEERTGGRLGLGYRLTPDLSVNTSLRAERVNIFDARTGFSPQLDAVVGDHDLFSGRVALTYDTRDIPFAPTEGHMFELSFEQAFGSFNYPRVEADYRRYFLVAQRPDGSGRHVLSFQFRGAYTGEDTPIFEKFYAGGYSSLRGFDFRGANPKENGVQVGGDFLFLGSVQYQFPLTQDDMLSAVAFVDYGTVEEDVEIDSGNYRVAPGFGLRIAVPAIGPAPIALDFAFPINEAITDDTEVFSFFIGLGR